MASNGSSAGGLRAWNAGDRALVLNVGDQAHRSARNIGTDTADIHENVLIEQVGIGPNGATIKVSAYGRSNTYEHVTSISGSFDGGNDIVTIDPSVTIPVTIHGGAGNDVITFAGTGGATLNGDGDHDVISVTGSGDATVNGGSGNDFLEHEGTGTVIMSGGLGTDVLTGSSLTDELYGNEDNDQLQGLAGVYDGGAGNDNLFVTLSTARVPVITGGTGTGDILTLTLSGGADTLLMTTIDDPAGSQDGVRLDLNTVWRDTTGLEVFLIDAGTGADTITVGYLASASVSQVSIDVGTGSADTVVVLGSSAAETVVLTYVTRADRPANEVSIAGIGGYGVWVGRTVRSQGDTIEVRAGAGADTLDASALTGLDRVAVVLRGEGGDDRLIGTPFDDVLDGGADDDRVTGGAGRDTFVDSGGRDTLVESFDSDFGLYDNLFVVGVVGANGVDFTSGVVEDLGGIFEAAELEGGAGNNRFLIGDADGVVVIAGVTRTARAWTGDATLTPLGGNDVVRVELRDALGTRVHVTDSAGTDRLEVWGTSLRDDLVVDVTGGRGQVRRVLPGGAADQSAVDHLGVELVEIRTLGGGDRVAVRRMAVEHLVELGEGDDLLAVGTRAAIGFDATTWPNSGGLLDDIDARLTVDGGSGPGSFTGLDLLTVDDTGDPTANTGVLTSTTITGLGLASAGITYLAFEDLTIALGSGGDTLTVDSTHAGPVRPTVIHTNAGADLVVIRTISGPLAVFTGSEDDTVRVSSTATGIGGAISGITALLTVDGGTGTNDRLFVDDVATSSPVIGVVTDRSISGLGMTLGGSAARPSLVQVVTVQGAVDGRFTLTVAGIGTTSQLDYDATAAQVRRALEALPGIDPGDVVVARAGGRWAITWAGALAGEAGWSRLITLGSVATYPLGAAPSGPAVLTSVTQMSDGYLGYTGFEALDLSLGSGNDVVTVDSTLVGTTVVNAGPGDDRVFVEAVGGTTRVNGQGGADWLVVNAVPDAPGTNPMDGKRLTLDGGTGSDTSVVGLWGVGNSRIDVIDTGYDGGTNVLYIEGPATSDTFLLRSGLVALLSARGTDGRFASAEKVTYTDGINGSVVLNGNAGDDTFALDDTSTVITVNGGSGNDRFRIGQIFTAYTADLEFGIPPTQFFSSTRGLLSNGISFPAVLNGGSGDDTFEVFRNKATLTLNGNAGDDTFIVRTFVAESAVTAVNAGQGRDFIEYAMNAPVTIDGGDGNDLVVVIGTEVGDTFVVTANGVYGAGRFVSYVNVERLSLYGMEGDDRFFVVSTNPGVQTSIFGGLGSDRIEVGGQAPAVQANDLLGHSGLVRHSVESTVSGSWSGIPVDGIGAEILDDDAPALSVDTLGGTIVVGERTQTVTGTIRVRPTRAPTTEVEVTVVAPAVDINGRTRALELSLDGVTWQTSVTLVFAAGSTTSQLLRVRATFDNAAEGDLLVPLQTMVAGRLSGAVASATATTLTVGGTPFTGRTLTGLQVVITSGTGAGQVRTIMSNTASSLTVAAWAVALDTTSRWMVRGVGEYHGLVVANTVVRLLDDEVPAVAVVVPDGGIAVVEPVGSGGPGGTSQDYTVQLTRAPLATVTVRINGSSQLLYQLVSSPDYVDLAEGLAPASTLTLTFTTGNWDALRTIRVTAIGDGVVEGQHVTLVATTVLSSDARTGTVGGLTGRADEFTVAGSPYAAHSLRGYLIRVTGGTGAGQVRTIWDNLADTIVVDGDWDVLPDTTSTFVITGYTAPAATGELGGTVTNPDTNGDGRTVTISGVTLPTSNGGLTGALLRIVGASGEVSYRVIASNTATTITVVDPWGAGAIVVGTQLVVVGVLGLTVPAVQVLVHDADTKGVVVTPTGDTVLRLVEGALAGQFGDTASYTVRLTRSPAAGETVTVVLRPILTPSLDIGGPHCGLPSGCSRLQVEFVAGPGQTVLTDGSLRLTFTSATWAAAQTVTLRAVQDTVIDGNDVQAFADRSRRLTGIQGPLFVSGGEDPNPPVQLTLDGYLPILLPGESSGEPLPITASTAGAVEPAQVDRLIVHNEDSPAADTGTLTGDQITGLGMAGASVLGGVLMRAGIVYAAFEDLLVLLGYGADTFTVDSTHIGTTTIDAGRGNDEVRVRTVAGHTLVLGSDGNDTFRIGSTSGLLDLLAALLVLDGGLGTDTAWLDDSADLEANLGTITQSTVTGLDMVAGNGGTDELGRPRPLDGVFAVTPRAGATSFTVVLSQVTGGVTSGIGAATFAVGATAEQVRLALQLLLFPQTSGADTGVSMTCGVAGVTRCSESVYVWLVGGTYLIGFRGEVNADPTQPVSIRLHALGTGAPATDGPRREGVTYDGLETLNLALGSGSDVLNVQGTRPVTNVSLGAGNDRVYVSSKAAVGLADKPQFLAGDLDLIAGTLNLDLGAGRHTLLVSDEDSPVADTSVLLTDVAAAARARDAALAADAEIFLVGLAPAGISWKVGPTGTLADGIRIWTGSGADIITVDGTHRRAGVRTTTWLNTGLGNDVVVVSLTQGQDGFLVLNTQGPNDNVLPLGSDLTDGDEPVQPDVVTGITVNGAPLAAGRYVVSSRQDLVGLFDSLLTGDTVGVTLDVRTTAVLRATGSVTVDLATLGVVAHALVGYRVWVNGVLVSPVSVVGTVLTIAAGTQRDGGASLVVVEVTRRHTETFTLPSLGGPDNDVVDARTSTLPLVIFGGQGSDTIHGGSGGDIVLGDRGRVLWFTPGTVPVAGLGGGVIDAAALAALEAVATAVSGNGGFGDTTDGVEGLVGIVVTVDPTIGGADTITTGLGSDLVLGGAGGDTITTNRGETPGTPDAPGIVIADHGFIDTVLLDGDPTDLDRIWSTDVAHGGNDTVTTGNGDDIIIGGTGGDTIVGGDGRNIVVGDNGRFTAIADETRRWGQLPLSSGSLETVSPAVGGADTITTGSGVDIVLGGALGDTIDVGGGNDLVLGDHGIVTWLVLGNALQVARAAVTDNASGGADTIRGRAGEDVLIGGAAGDTIDAGEGRDLVFGDNVVLDRTLTFGNHTSPRFRVLAGTKIYSTDLLTAGQALVTAAWQNDPAGATAWSDFRITLLDHDTATQALGDNRFGNDYIAGGAGDDTIFGQLGNDVIQGDGSIDGPIVGASRDSAGRLVLTASVGAASDGDDYIEGGGGRDVVFGGLGRDDIIGGSSDLFSLTTMDRRPDVGDLLFGGTGGAVGRNDETALHGRDSDTIVGDNGQVLRIVVVGATTVYPVFTYDTYAEAVRLLPRAVVLLDYSPGGPDLNPGLFPGMTQAASAGSGTGTVDVWGSDEVHGEAGDDTVYTGGGNDVVFGDAGDDDIIGGWGHDWVSGGSGTDGVIGDDGRIFTSRNGLTELLNGVTSARSQLEITTPGRLQVAVIFPTGKLTKTVDITPFALDGRFDNPLFVPLYANDVIYGGLGDDFLHGAAGDDAISGAEALLTSWAATYTGANPTGVVETSFTRPYNDGTLLGFDRASGDFILYDEYDPRRLILLNANGTLSKTGSGLAWFLTNAATDRPAGSTGTASDGDDAIFGAHGNDWLVGGTGRDTLWGGWGNDLLDADDLKTTNNGLNDTTDTDASYEDRAVGGAGLDVLIANTGGDRLIDWVGEFNSYIVPFAAFGAATVSRAVLPALMDFLYLLSNAQGADFTIAQLGGTGTASRNGEPWGEAGIVIQKDEAWQDQTGGPRDPQPGNIPGGRRDVLRSADFNSSATLDGFFVDSGSFAVVNGALSVTAASLGRDAAAVFYVDSYLPIYYEISANITTTKPTGGWKANAYIIFDYFSPTDFKFAGIDMSTNKLVMGRRTPAGWEVDTVTPYNAKAGTFLPMLVAVNGTTVTVTVNGAAALTHTFAPRILDGVAYGLNKGMVGMGSDNARGQFDNVSVRILPPQVTLDRNVDLTRDAALLTPRPAGTWTAGSGGLTGSAPAGQPALAVVPVPNAVTGASTGGRIASTSWLEVTARLSTSGMAGIAFDVYGSDSLKLAVLDVAGQRVLLGHLHPRAGFVVDAAVPWVLKAGTFYTLTLTLKGASASLMVDGSFAMSTGYNAGVVDGFVGLVTRGSTATFTSVRLRTDDPAYIPAAAFLRATTVGPGVTTGSVAVLSAAAASATAAARASWLAAGADTALLAGLEVVVTSLPGTQLGATVGRTVYLDDDAAGWGWSVTGGRMDLLSVLLHELGHVLGLGHTDDGVMSALLAPGARLAATSLDGAAPTSARTSTSTPEAPRATPERASGARSVASPGSAAAPLPRTTTAIAAVAVTHAVAAAVGSTASAWAPVLSGATPQLTRPAGSAGLAVASTGAGGSALGLAVLLLWLVGLAVTGLRAAPPGSRERRRVGGAEGTLRV